jgi:hypothetical protein
MFVLMLPLVVAYTVLGCLTGFFAGRKLWGNVGGFALGMMLGLAPAVAGLFIGMFLLWNSNLFNR